MSLPALRSLISVSKILPSKALLFNSISRSLFRVGEKNTRTLTRSLFFLCRSRDTDPIASTASKVPWTNKCSCGCSVHTKGDDQLVAFLAEEIENETKAQAYENLPALEGFECKLSGADVTLTKKFHNELITIKSNVNNSVDAEEAVADPNEDSKEPQDTEMKAKPEFTVEIKKGKKILSFLCTYSHELPDQPNDAYDDTFQISEVSMYEEEFEDSTYCVSADIMDGYLYDLLMNYLEDRGISNDFAEKMVTFFTSYEHKLYINLLKGLKSFVEK